MKTITCFLVTLCAVMGIYGVVLADTPYSAVEMNLKYDGKTHKYAALSINMNINGKSAVLKEMPPVILESRTYVPAREVFEPLGAGVEWLAESKEMKLTYNERVVVMAADKDEAYVDGTELPLENPAKLINDKIMLPVRFVAEQFKMNVDWDDVTRTVYIVSSLEDEIPIMDGPSDQSGFYGEGDDQGYEESDAETTGDDDTLRVYSPSTDLSTKALTVTKGQPVNVLRVVNSDLSYSIEASGAISKAVKTLTADNKLVIDIYNATDLLQKSSYTFEGFSGVSAVRNSQFALEPEKITRVVFDLKGSTKFSVSFNDARTSVNVVFAQNVISNVEILALAGEEQVIVESASPPVFKVRKIESPLSLVFETDARSPYGNKVFETDTKIVKSIALSQADQTTTKITLTLNEDCTYALVPAQNGVNIAIMPITYYNVKFAEENGKHSLILENVPGLAAESIVFEQWEGNVCKAILPGDYESVFGYGKFLTNDESLKSVEIETSGNVTKMILSLNAPRMYIAEKNGNNIVIKPEVVLKQGKAVVYIDAGHGLADSGASGNGLREKDINLQIVKELYALFDADASITVYASRLDDSYPANSFRASEANRLADLFISIHQNSAGRATSRGTEVLYFNHENEVYPNITSEAVARTIQSNFILDIGTTDRGVVKRPDLIVLNQTTIPAVLVECGFISNFDDALIVSDPYWQRKIAESIYRSVKQIFEKYTLR